MAQLTGLQMSARNIGPQLASAAAGAGSLRGMFAQLAAAAGPAGLAITGASLAIGGVASAAFGAVRAMSDTVEQLDRIAARTGVGVSELQVMRRIITDSGGSAESLTSALSYLNRAIAEQRPELAALGITTRDTFTAFMQLAGALAASTDDAADSKLAMELLGRGGADLLGVVNQLASDYPEMAEAMRRSGALLEGDVLGTLREFDAETEKAALVWDGFTTRVLGSLAPMAAGVIKWANEMWDALSGRVDVAAETARLETAIAQLQSAIATGSRVTTEGGRYDDLSLEGKQRALENMKRMLAELKTETNVLAPAGSQEAVRIALEAAEALKKKAEAEKKAAEEAAKHAESLRISAQAIRDESAALAASFRYKGELRGQAAQQLQPTGMAEAPTAEEVERLRVKTGPEQMEAVLNDWRTFTDEVLSGAQVLNSALSAVQQGLQAGFSTVFVQMLTGAVSFAQAMRSIFQSLVNAIIAELERLAAYAVVKGLLNLVTAGAGGAAMSVGSAASIAGSVVNPLGATAAAQSAASAVTNVTINALDARSVLQQTMSPSGALRLTNLRMAELAAVA